MLNPPLRSSRLGQYGTGAVYNPYKSISLIFSILDAISGYCVRQQMAYRLPSAVRYSLVTWVTAAANGSGDKEADTGTGAMINCSHLIKRTMTFLLNAMYGTDNPCLLHACVIRFLPGLSGIPPLIAAEIHWNYLGLVEYQFISFDQNPIKPLTRR